MSSNEYTHDIFDNMYQTSTLIAGMTGVAIGALVIMSLAYACLAVIAPRRSLHGMRDRLRSRIYEYHITRSSWPDIASRRFFYELPFEVDERLNTANPHAKEAKLRGAANDFVKQFTSHFGRELFSISGSTDDCRELHATRLHYTLKDLSNPHKFDEPPDTCVYKMTDVDYYGDSLPRVLEYFQPVITYSFTPATAGDSDGNVGHYFNADGTVSHYVDNHTYTHHLWDVEDDVSIVRTAAGYNIYKVQKRVVAKNRSMMLFSPVAQITGVLPALASMFRLMPLDGQELSRMNPVVPNTNLVAFRTRDSKNETEMLTVGRCGIPAAATYRYSLHPLLHKSLGLNELKFGSAVTSIKTVTGLPDTCCPFIMDYYSMALSTPPVVSHPAAVHYAWQAPKPHEVLKPALRKLEPLAYMGPAVPCIPLRCKTNLRAAHTERTEKVRPTIDHVGAFVSQCMDEFLAIMIAVPHRGAPTDLDACYDRQRPPKKPAFLEAMNTLLDITHLRELKIRPFMKSEAYGEIKAPREIRDYPALDRPSQARYLYSLEAPICGSHWYAFGKTPRQVEQMVSTYLARNPGVMENDFSKYDGTISFVARELETRCFLRFYSPQFHVEALEVHSNLHHRHSTTGDSTQFERLSGGFDTSLMNTLVAAFTDFLALRKSGESATTAYAKIGLHGGDDSLTAIIEERHVQWACKQMGLTIKTSVKQYGTAVSFLGRIYGASSWCGRPNSVIDLPRTMTKFSMTAKGGHIPDAELVALKAASLKALDSNYPLIARFCTLVTANLPRVDIRDVKYRLHMSYHLRQVVEARGEVAAHSYHDDGDWYGAYLVETGFGPWMSAFQDAVTNSNTYQEMADRFGKSYLHPHVDTSQVFTQDQVPPRHAPGGSTNRHGKQKQVHVPPENKESSGVRKRKTLAATSSQRKGPKPPPPRQPRGKPQ